MGLLVSEDQKRLILSIGVQISNDIVLLLQSTGIYTQEGLIFWRI
jgi:hypothetical protein